LEFHAPKGTESKQKEGTVVRSKKSPKSTKYGQANGQKRETRTSNKHATDTRL